MLVGPSKCLKQIIKILANITGLIIPTDWRQTIGLFTSLVEDLNSWLPWTIKSSYRLPWVPETFLARFPVSVAARGFGLLPEMCRPSANTENSRRTREKPLVPRVASGQSENWTRGLLVQRSNRSATLPLMVTLQYRSKEFAQLLKKPFQRTLLRIMTIFWSTLCSSLSPLPTNE